MSNEFQAILPANWEGGKKRNYAEGGDRERESKKKTIKITLLVSWLLQLWPLSSSHRCPARLAKYKRKTNCRNFTKVNYIKKSRVLRAS